MHAHVIIEYKPQPQIKEHEQADALRPKPDQSCFLTTMSALPPSLPPATPIRRTVIPDPFSATSTLTPLSSVGDSWAKSSSPSALSRPRTSSPEDGDGSPPPTRRTSQRLKRPTRFDALLTPQKALPAKMKLVSDSDAVTTGKASALGRNGLRRKRKRRATSDDEGSELEVWRREDCGRSFLPPPLSRERELEAAGLTMLWSRPG